MLLGIPPTGQKRGAPRRAGRFCSNTDDLAQELEEDWWGPTPYRLVVFESGRVNTSSPPPLVMCRVYGAVINGEAGGCLLRLVLTGYLRRSGADQTHRLSPVLCYSGKHR